MKTLKSPRTTLALTLALVTTLAGQTTAPADAATAHMRADSVAVNAVGAHALHDGRTWTEPRADWRSATRQPGAVPADPANDKPAYYADGCHSPKKATKPPTGCVYGDPSGATTWMLAGSSKSGTYGDILAEIAERDGARLRIATRSTTPFTPGVGSGTNRAFNDTVLDEISATRPDVVFVTPDPGADPYDVETMVRRTLGAGAHHVALLWNPGMQDGDPLNAAGQAVAQKLRSASWVDVSDWVYPAGQRPASIGGVGVKGSGSHLTSTYVNTLELPLQSELHDAGLVDADPDAVKRVAGKDRYETAALLSYGDGQMHTREVYVASGRDWPDALAASAQTGTTTKLVLTRPGSVPRSVIEASDWLYASYSTASVLGGPGVVSDAVMDRLGESYESVNRVAGANRYETAVRIAEDVNALTPTDRVFITSGQTWADSVTAASVADPESGDVLLLTKKGALPAVTREFLAEVQPTEVVVVGGPAVVSDAVVSQVQKTIPGAKVTRVAGQDRYATSAQLVTRFAGGSTHAHVATGADYPDALAAGQDGSPVLLTKPDQLPSATRAVIAGQAREVTVVGGWLAVSPAVERQIHNALAD